MALNLSSILGGGLILKRQIFTTNGTWNRPAKMAGNTVFLTGIGGGSSGRASNSRVATIFGGDGGQYVIQVPVDIGSSTSVSVTIGVGGASSAINAAPNHGSPTSFGTLLTLLGGTNRGTSGAPVPVGAPGGQGSSQTTMNGSDTPLGYGGKVYSTSTSGIGCGGGGILIGGNHITASVGAGSANLTPAQGYGSGGGGQSVGSSGAGANGVLMVEWMEFA